MIEPDLRRALHEVAKARVLLVASDFDGTLSPIVPDPEAALADREAVDALMAIAALPRTHAAVISGRSRPVLGRLTGWPPGVVLIGSHGAEEADLDVDPEVQRAVSKLTTTLQDIAESYPGSVVEAKPLGAAFHVRHCANPPVAAAAAGAAGRRAGAGIIEGKMVVELLFGPAGKGVALDRLRQRLDSEAVVFLGDDVTDEAGFSALGARDVAIKVGRGETVAPWCIDTQAHVAPVLAIVAEARGAATHSS